MPSSTIRFTPEFIKSCENIWRDGFTKSSSGVDDPPDFKSFFVNDKIKAEPTFSEMENLPFNPCKCEARVEKHGFAIQCTRSPFEGRSLCKTHLKMFDKLPEGKDIPYGRFNKPRPDITLDKGNPINWGPKKSRKNSTSEVQNKPKLKVGEMRDYLSSRIPNTVFKSMKKKELTELYLSEKEKENSTPKSPSSDASGPDNSQVGHENHHEKTVEGTPEEKQEEDSEEQREGATEEQQGEVPEEKQEEVPEEKQEGDTGEKQEEDTEEKQEGTLEGQQDDGTGVGLKLEISCPKTISEFKNLFKELNIDSANLKGKRQYKQAYDDYLKSKLEEEDEEKTQSMSDEDELNEDMNTYDETTFDGVSYLEDEETGKIYNLKHQHVGKWNEDVDDIIWISEEFKTAHETARQ